MSKPGVKEYAIVGGAALAIALGYLWWKKHQAAAAAPADTTDTGTTAPGTPTGLSTSALMAWIQDHSSSTTTTTKPPPPNPGPASGKAEVPDVVGMKGSAAEALLKARGFRTTQSPAQTKRGKVTRVVSQAPGASPQPRGSTVHVQLEVA
jgi:hypothetical protein